MRLLIIPLLLCKTCIVAQISHIEKQPHNGGIPWVSTMGHLTTMGCLPYLAPTCNY